MAFRVLEPELMAPLLALLFLVTATEAADTSNGTLASSSSSNANKEASAVPIAASSQSQRVFSLDNYGAHGDGKNDDTWALANTWRAACSSPQPATVLVPGGKRYLLKPITLSGPCKSGVVLTVKGTLVASPNRSDWSDEDRRHWIALRRVNTLTVNGGGAIDGNGETWWKYSCKVNRTLPCKEAPTAFSFHECTNLTVEDLLIVNSQKVHVSVANCTNAQLARLSITAPGKSPNTDGIQITRSKDVKVANCKIQTGDDCISIKKGTQNLHVSNVVCGPGHGISIGSLGEGNSWAEVSGITVDTVQLYGTTNGARIKTYQGGLGYAKDIKFQNIIMYNVINPIFIDQNYCDKITPCEEQESAVEVSNVVFRNITGTTVTKNAIKMNCSKNVPCHDIALQNIDLKLEGGKNITESTCQNVQWRKSGIVLPQPCTA